MKLYSSVSPKLRIQTDASAFAEFKLRFNKTYATREEEGRRGERG